MASYPSTIPTFTTKVNVTSIVDANDPNSIQSELVAMATTLGVNPHISSARSTTYADVDTRLERLELDYSIGTHTHAHSTLTGLASGDDHSQYMLATGTRHDLTARHTFGAALPTPGAATTSAVGDAAAAGSAAGPARADHVHGREGFGAPAASAPGDAQTTGTATTLSHSDHKHAREAWGVVGDIVAASVTAAAAAGATGHVADAGHTHAGPGFGAVSAETSFGIAAANGTATTVPHSDHTHGTPSLATTVSSQLMSDAGTVGTGTAAAKEDHKHAMPGYALVGDLSTMQVYGISPSAGTSNKLARADHNHGTPDPTLQGPTGVIVAYGGTTAPSGWLLCDGTAVSRTTYATLFGVIGTRYGTGDGSTTFNVPDLRSRLPFGQATAAAAVSTANQGSHTHPFTSGAGSTHTHSGSSAGGSAHTHTITPNTNTGAGSSHQHTGNTGGDSVNHTHTMANHVHSYISPSSSAGSANTGTPNGNTSDGVNQFHSHSFTSDAEASHTHAIGAITASNESAHTHTITVGNEAAHTHTGTSDATANIPVQSVNYIVKT